MYDHSTSIQHHLGLQLEEAQVLEEDSDQGDEVEDDVVCEVCGDDGQEEDNSILCCVLCCVV